MNPDQVAAVRELLLGTPWIRQTREFARSLRRAGHHEGGLLVVGTPTEEPWHLTAHLADEARWAGLPELAPTLVRWQAPPDAPAHLAVTLRRLEEARRGETVFVVAPDDPTDALLERVSDARRDGAVVLSLDRGQRELEALAHDVLTVPAVDVAPVSFDVAGHLVTAAAGEPQLGRRGVRARIAALLDAAAGTQPRR